MSAPTYFLGTVRDGKFRPDDSAAFIRVFATKKDGTRMRVTAVKDVPKRTDGMNRFWWKCVVEPFREEMGIDDKDEAHREILIAIGHWYWQEVFGERKKMPKATHNLSEDAFMELVGKAERLFLEYFNGRIPARDSEHARAMMAGA
jgi:hypothetical protein